jgi:hypothetical protein
MTALPAAGRTAAVNRVDPTLRAMAGDLLVQVEQLLGADEEVRDLEWSWPHRVASSRPLGPSLVLLALTDRRLLVAREDRAAGVPPTAWPVDYGHLPVVPGTRWTTTGMAQDGRSMVAFRRRVAPMKAYLATPPPRAAWLWAGASPAAWHPDPHGRHEQRWWDGREWTSLVADGGVEAEDPLG